MVAGRLTRQIPATVKIVEFGWIKRDFIVMCEAYRKAQGATSDPLNMCFWCRVVFDEGDMIALAHRKGKTHVVLCQGCADTAIKAVR